MKTQEKQQQLEIYLNSIYIFKNEFKTHGSDDVYPTYNHFLQNVLNFEKYGMVWFEEFHFKNLPLFIQNKVQRMEGKKIHGNKRILINNYYFASNKILTEFSN